MALFSWIFLMPDGRRLQRRQSAHPSYFVDGEYAVAQQDFLNLRLFHWVAGSIDVGEDKFQVTPAESLRDGVAGEMFGEQSCCGHDRLAKCLVVHFFRGRTIDV